MRPGEIVLTESIHNPIKVGMVGHLLFLERFWLGFNYKEACVLVHGSVKLINIAKLPKFPELCMVFMHVHGNRKETL